MKKILIIGAFFILCMNAVNAQELVYTPINPSFGGNSFNHAWMMSEAEAQNKFKDKSTSSFGYSERDPLKDFEESLSRQILSQLSREIITDTFGETDFEEGNYEIGNYSIEIVNDLDGVNINITDNANNSSTEIVIPYY